MTPPSDFRAHIVQHFAGSSQSSHSERAEKFYCDFDENFKCEFNEKLDVLEFRRDYCRTDIAMTREVFMSGRAHFRIDFMIMTSVPKVIT